MLLNPSSNHSLSNRHVISTTMTKTSKINTNDVFTFCPPVNVSL